MRRRTTKKKRRSHHPRENLEKADCFGIISFRPRESPSIAPRLERRRLVFLKPKKVRREKKKVVREFLLSSRVKTPRAASMKKKRSKGNPSKQETLACRCGLRCWRERWAGAGRHALTLRPRHRRPVRCVSLVVMSDGQ